MAEHDLEATYLDESSAAETLKELQRAGLSVDAAREERRDPLTSPSRQAEDVQGMGAGPGPSVPAMTKHQYRNSVAGAAMGALLLGALGAAAATIALILGAIGWEVLVAIFVAGVVAGATAGAIVGGRKGGEAQIEREEREHVSALRVLVHVGTDAEARRAREMMQRNNPENMRELRRRN